MNNPHLALIFIRQFPDFFRKQLDQLSIFSQAAARGLARHLSPLARRLDQDHGARPCPAWSSSCPSSPATPAYRGEPALCEPTHRPRQIHGAAGCEATRGRYRMPPPAGTACAVDAIPSQAGSEMPIRQGARQAPAPPLPASTAEGDAQPRHCALRWTRAPTLGQIEG